MAYSVTIIGRHYTPVYKKSKSNVGLL